MSNLENYEAFEKLRITIVLSAVDEMELIYKRLFAGKYKTRTRLAEANQRLNEIIDFIHSPWWMRLTGGEIDPERTIQHVRKKAEMLSQTNSKQLRRRSRKNASRF